VSLYDVHFIVLEAFDKVTPICGLIATKKQAKACFKG